MGKGFGWRVAGMVVLGAWLGCGNSDVFLCHDDSGCQQGGDQGVCQATGYCSFPDAQCESGQRYGGHAGGSLSDTCVDPDDVVTTMGTGPGDGSGPDTTPTDPSVSTTLPTSGSAEGTTASLEDTGPTADTGPSTATATGTGSGGTTTGGGVQCRVDEFEDDLIHPDWCVSTDPGTEVSEHDGRLWIDLVPAAWGMDDGVGEIEACDPFPLRDAVATVEVDQVPQSSTYTEAFMEMGNDAARLGIGVLDDQLHVFVWNGVSYAGVSWQPYMPAGQRHWRLRGTRRGLVAEHSPDGAAWVHVYTSPLDLAGQEGTVWLGAWSEQVPLGPDAAAYERLELCAQAN